MYRQVDTFYSNEDMDIETEVLTEGGYKYLFAHVEVLNLTKSAFKLGLEKWEKMKEKAISDGFSHIHTYTQNPSFVSRLGVPINVKEVIFETNKYEVWTWQLD